CRSAAGLASQTCTPGSGETTPVPTCCGTGRYTSWTTDGKMRDTSISRGKAATFPLDRVIAGWIEGVQLLVTGEKRRFWIPEALAYKGQREPYGMLVFDIELVKIDEFRTASAADATEAQNAASRTH